jgi:hypothetical protein
MPRAKHRTPIVPARVRVAVDILLNDPTADLAKAAAACGLPTNRLRDQLKLPHVRNFINEERGAFIDALCAGNVPALKDIRDNSQNAMARVAAIRQAEMMKETLDGPGGSSQFRHSPGLIVQIVNSTDGRVAQTIGPSSMPRLEFDSEAEAERLPAVDYNPP